MTTERQNKNEQKCIKIRVNPLNPCHPCSILMYAKYLTVRKKWAYSDRTTPMNSGEEARF